MKTHHYTREETDTFDEVNKVVNELRGEIVKEFWVVEGNSVVFDAGLRALKSRIAKLENPEELESKKKPPKNEPPSAKNKKKSAKNKKK